MSESVCSQNGMIWIIPLHTSWTGTTQPSSVTGMSRKWAVSEKQKEYVEMQAEGYRGMWLECGQNQEKFIESLPQ